MKITKEEALKYHATKHGGKLDMTPSVPFKTQKDLSLAYSPGVAEVSKAIAANAADAMVYTDKKNLIGVISNGTAVLGLGNIGALASKPVMEGKSILFKRFADINSYDVEVDETNVDEFCKIVKAISPTFGGINLEDIKAPECFEIEERLINELNIPIMHDDQHGTAIITTAGMINACEISGRKVEDLRVVIIGAGAAAIASGNIYREMGVKNIIMTDSKGVIHKGRKDLNKYKQQFAIDKEMSLSEAFVGADMVLGLSVPGSFTVEDVAKMNDKPIIFALANPTPEVFPEDVMKVKSGAIVGTGRSDYPNQINNVLGFPYIFRGALDVGASKVTMNMKIKAARALAKLSKEKVPQDVKDIYGVDLSFGNEYIIPKPFDNRLCAKIATAVAAGAIEDGVARIKDFDLKAYEANLRKTFES